MQSLILSKLSRSCEHCLLLCCFKSQMEGGGAQPSETGSDPGPRNSCSDTPGLWAFSAGGRAGTLFLRLRKTAPCFSPRKINQSTHEKVFFHPHFRESIAQKSFKEWLSSQTQHWEKAQHYQSWFCNTRKSSHSTFLLGRWNLSTLLTPAPAHTLEGTTCYTETERSETAATFAVFYCSL